MKKTIKLIAISAVLFTSCAKDIEMCVDGNFAPEKPGTYTYTWCGANADRIQWVIPSNILWSTSDGFPEGESITLELTQEGPSFFTVSAENKRMDASMQYEIKVGTYGARVELNDCSNSPLVNGNGGENFRAYLYLSITDLQNDLRNNNFNNCLDSITLESSNYYNFDIHDQPSLTGEFKGDYANGDYLVYVQEFEKPSSSFYSRNNLISLLVYGASYATIIIQNGDYDDRVGIVVNPNSESNSNKFIKNLVSKSYLLTDVMINGSSQGVSTCNADDIITFNIDGTWIYDVGSDNCMGNQTTSQGTFYGFSACTNDVTSSTLNLTADSGSMAGLGTNYYLTYYSNTKIQLSYYFNGSNIVQEFTIQ